MKTVILGAGAQGAILAAHLHHAGRDVTVVAREPRASLIEREGLRITGLIDLREDVRVVREAGQAGSADLYINTLKTYADDGVLQGLDPGPGATALSVQNGVLKTRVLARVFGSPAVLGAASFIGGAVLADGAVRMTEEGGLQVGELGRAESGRCKEVAAFLNASGIDTEIAPDISAVEWAKFALFVPLFSVALMTRQEPYSFLSHSETARLVAMLMREMVTLAEVEGVKVANVGDCAAAAIAAMPIAEAVGALRAHGGRLAQRLHRHKVSGLQDLERGRPTELHETVGHALQLADARGLELPHMRTCYAVCAAISPPLLRPTLVASQPRC